MLRLIQRVFSVWTVIAAVVFVALNPARAATTTLQYIHTDVAGSVIGRTNDAGNVNWRESYRPYGERTVNSAGAVGNRQFFHGKAFDADTELGYFGARYYDPLVGRFMGMDPQHFDETNLHSFNRYAYGNNNPYKFKDPDGNSPLSVLLIEAAKYTGAGFALGIAADAISQAAAFGQVDWSMAATSNAAIAGGATGLLSGLGIGAVKSARETTTLYRAVSEAEFRQIEKTGAFEVGPNSMQGKFFAESARDAKKWGDALNGPGKSKIVEVQLPKNAADNLQRWERLDGIGPARYGELNQLRDAIVKEVK